MQCSEEMWQAREGAVHIGRDGAELGFLFFFSFFFFFFFFSFSLCLLSFEGVLLRFSFCLDLAS